MHARTYRDKAKVYKEDAKLQSSRKTETETEREREITGGRKDWRENLCARVGTQWQCESQLPAGPEVDGRPSWQPDVHPKCLVRSVVRI